MFESASANDDEVGLELYCGGSCISSLVFNMEVAIYYNNTNELY